MQLSIFAITTPPSIPGDLHQKFAPTRALLHPIFCQGAGREFVGVVPKGAGMFYKTIFAIFRIFIIMVADQQMTTLWGLFVALKLYTF